MIEVRFRAMTDDISSDKDKKELARLVVSNKLSYVIENYVKLLEIT